MKTCRTCQKSFPLDDFPLHPQMKDGHLNICKPCTRIQVKAWAAKHPDQVRDTQAAWRAANPDRIKEHRRRSYQVNKLNGKAAERSRIRRARQKAATPPGTRVSLKAILTRDGLFCHICQSTIDEPRKVSYDHVIPLSRGGEHVASNIKVAHRVCNSWKHDRLMNELEGAPLVDAPWQERIEELKNTQRSMSMKAAWKNLDWSQRNKKVSESMQGNTNGLGNPGSIRHGWGNGLDACVECGTDIRPHKAKGLCNACYLREYRTVVNY